MKNLLKKSILGAAIVVFGFALVFTQSAFKTQQDDVVYQYMSSSDEEEDILDINNWEVADETPSCGETGPLVCQYTFAGNIVAFQAFLEDEETTAAQINLDATAHKQ